MNSYVVPIFFRGVLRILASRDLIDYEGNITRGIMNGCSRSRSESFSNTNFGEVMPVKQGILTTKEIWLICGERNIKVSN